MKKKILITGSNGLLGTAIVRLLHRRDADFMATSVGQNRFSEFEIPYKSLDITNEYDVYSALSGYKPDVVINCAAYTQVDACETERERCYDINVKAVRNLARCAEEFNVHLIHLSTDFIFNGENGPYDESSEADPLGYYGMTKWLAEQLLEEAQAPITILRTSIVYGFEPHIQRNNIILWLRNSFLNDNPVKIVRDQYRCITFADDLAEICVSAAENGVTGVFNATGKEYMSMLELAQRMADYYGASRSLITPIDTAELGQKAMRPPKTQMIIDKAQKALNYAPLSLEESLNQIEGKIKSQS